MVVGPGSIVHIETTFTTSTARTTTTTAVAETTTTTQI